ncbi:MAG: hypothetical protein EXS05_21180 [Planctomycetaceae bacterium]|nr:hypothetical protein [Planctomycetaceae bacterium]
MWFTENPWPPLMISGILACILLGAWYSRRRNGLLLAGLAAIAGCVAIYFIEKSIVTDAEVVEANIYKLTSSFQNKDRDAVLALISVQALELRQLVSKAMRDVDLGSDLDIKDVSVELINDKSQAITHFRANGTVTYRQFNAGFRPSRWELRWQREGADWRIVEIVRLHPLKNERMGVFDHGE